MAQRRNLLLCLDAFGTLFRPRRPIERQYAEVAAKHGLSQFKQEEVVEELRKDVKKAIEDESQKHPNYGKRAGLDASKWWANVIRNSLQPHVGSSQTLPPQIIPELLQRFSSAEGYELYDDVTPFFSMLHDTKLHLRTQPAPPPTSTLSVQWPWQRTIVGVITNSDDRVPGILRSLGLNVAGRRIGKRKGAEAKADLDEDVNFVVLSYDAGYEKPNFHIYDTAIWMLEECLAAEAKAGRDMRMPEFERLMVGDDLVKDYDGARNAGWDALHLDRNKALPGKRHGTDIQSVAVEEGEHVQVIDDLTKTRFWRPGDDET